jgi:hypothetical protein
MVLLTHILIALTSVALSTSLLFSPSHFRLYVSYGLITATFLSGTLLVLSTRQHMLETCLVGLAYSAFTLVATVVATRTLALAKGRRAGQ